jgi:hypothetical protein
MPSISKRHSTFPSRHRIQSDQVGACLTDRIRLPHSQSAHHEYLETEFTPLKSVQKIHKVTGIICVFGRRRVVFTLTSGKYTAYLPSYSRYFPDLFSRAPNKTALSSTTGRFETKLPSSETKYISTITEQTGYIIRQKLQNNC